MSARRLDFWFDFASTYSYVGAMQIESLCAEAGVPLRWRAFVLGPIFKLQGWETSPFNVNPLRGAYMWRDLARLTAKLAIPWRKPSIFPRNSVLAGRVAAAHADAPWLADFIRAVFVANFGQDREIGEERVVRDLIAQVGKNADEVLAVATDPQHSPALRKNTEEAIRLGIFGAPNCVVGGELFWGEEAMEDAISWARMTR